MTTTQYIIRCLAGGFVIGSRMENDFGEPLTKREANRLCKLENERSARRREEKLPGAFDFYVDTITRQTECKS